MSFAADFDELIMSPNCKPGTGGSIVALCFHDTEGGGTAADVGYFFQRPATQASTTGVIDDTSKVGCVAYGMTAWHTGHGDPWNYRIEGYEHVGFASWSRDEWLAHGAMLDRSAAHFAKRCGELGIPVRKIDGTQLRAAVFAGDPAQGGICGHKDISDATDGGHYDPGPNFPWDDYIARVQRFTTGAAPVPTPTPGDEIVTPDDIKAIAAEVVAQLGANAASNNPNSVAALQESTAAGFNKTIDAVNVAADRVVRQLGANGDGNNAFSIAEVLNRVPPKP